MYTIYSDCVMFIIIYIIINFICVFIIMDCSQSLLSENRQVQCIHY